MEVRERIARRVAKELKNGEVVNLGIGIPTMVAGYIPEDVHIVLQSENGFLGLGPPAQAGQEDLDLVNAGGFFSTVLPGASFFDSSMSFSLIRGGHVDVTVLGALQVDEKGNLANWAIPGKTVPGVGGAMDLTVGAGRVIIAMEHTAKGKPKILKNCTLPLTAVGEVDMIVTELAVMQLTRHGIELKEVASGISVEEVQAVTEAELIVNSTVEEMLF